MSRRTSRLVVATLATVLTLSAGAAVAAPSAKLQQFKVPTASSQPRAITDGSDGNRWFTEGTEFTNAPAKLGRITPRGAVTERPVGVADGCSSCILTDITQGSDGILYLTSNDPRLIRFDVTTGSFLTPAEMPDSGALGGNLAAQGDDVWVTDFNNDVVWRFTLSTGEFASFPAVDPADVAVDAAGNAWFTEPEPSGAIGRIDAVTGAVTRIDSPMSPRDITVATDGQVWFTARFTPQGVARLDPATGVITPFPLTDVGPSGIAASPDGSVWFTQETKGNVASITNAGVITEGKVVKGSEPFGVTVSSDGDPWYTMMAGNKIGTLRLP